MGCPVPSSTFDLEIDHENIVALGNIPVDLDSSSGSTGWFRLDLFTGLQS